MSAVGETRATGFFVSGGTMPLDSASYVERSSDKALYESLMAGKYCYVLNSRQMGKSSLSIRTLSKLGKAGVRTSLVDLTRIGGRNVTAQQWYAGLCDAIGSELGLQAEMLDYFRQNGLLSPMQRFFGALEEVALNAAPSRLVVFIDEIDSTKNLSFQADEFFAGIRECYNRRVQDETMERLSFCLIGVAVPTDLINNPSTTPFNIGERIQLNDFTLDEMQPLAGALGPNGPALVSRVHYWTSGQPFLSQSLCEAIAGDPDVQSSPDVDALVRSRLLERRARSININLSDVGERALNSGGPDVNPDRFRAELLSSYEKAWRGGFVPDDESNRVAVILKLSGLMRSDGRRLEVRNRIYREVFNRKWVEDNLPEKELLRERHAFRQGIARAASASATVILVVCLLGLYAWKSGNDAVSAKKMLDSELYVSDMNNMRLLEEIGDVSRMEEILNSTKDSPYRGFEWSFWLGRIHDSAEEYTLDYSAPGKREEGIVSQDGRQLCLYDSLIGVAAIVDRKTRARLAVRRVGRQVRIVATRIGFVSVQSRPSDIKVDDVVTGKNVSLIPNIAQFASAPIIRSRSDFAMMLWRGPGIASPHGVVLVDLVGGSLIYRRLGPYPVISGLTAFSRDGNRVLFAYAPTKDGSQDWVVIDTKRNVVIDRFEVTPRTSLEDFSDSGRMILFRDPQHKTLCRDVNLHRTIFEQAWAGGDLAAGALVTADDRAIVQYFGNGLATSIDLASGRGVILGYRVWGLGETESPDSVLAMSTSVRILGRKGQEVEHTVGQGVRLSRDDLGGLCAFVEYPVSIGHFTDPGLKLAYRTETPPRLRNSFPYNGRWRICADSTGKRGLFTDADGKMPPLLISPLPANYSCGDTMDSLVVLDRGRHTLKGLSATTGRPRWSYDAPGDPISGLWVTPRGDTALALSGDVALLAIDVKTGKLRATLGGHNVRIANLTFTRDRNQFFTCGVDGRVILWDLATLKMVSEFRGNAAMRVSSADISPDRKRVATCNFTGSWQLWDATSGRELMDIHGSALPLRSILFTTDGQSVVTAGDDLRVRRWSAMYKDPSTRIPIAKELLSGISY